MNQNLAAKVQQALIDAWDEGHAATDEQCPNPYRARAGCSEPECIKSVEHPGDRHISADGSRWWTGGPKKVPRWRSEPAASAPQTSSAR